MVSYAEIHNKLKLSGSAQFPSGIRRTADGRGFVLIAMSSGKYRDNLKGDGTLMYMGHGQGDQMLWRDNKKLNDAPMDTPLYVFVRKQTSGYRFVGIFKKTGAVREQESDGRRVLIFPLKKCVPVLRNVPVVPSIDSNLHALDTKVDVH